MKKSAKEDSFIHVIVGDVVNTQKRLKRSKSSTIKRDLVRATFAAIEGSLFILKNGLKTYIEAFKPRTPHLLSVLDEETWFVNDKGDISKAKKFVPITNQIKLIAKVLSQHLPKQDYEHIGYKSLVESIDVRNRLTHPKSLSDLNVSDAEVRSCNAALFWVLAFVMESQETIRDSVTLHIKNR
ncbi:MAG: hypothetical protein AB7G06_09445 [Bdellovibrionales bacterium]